MESCLRVSGIALSRFAVAGRRPPWSSLLPVEPASVPSRCGRISRRRGGCREVGPSDCYVITDENDCYLCQVKKRLLRTQYCCKHVAFPFKRTFGPLRSAHAVLDGRNNETRCLNFVPVGLGGRLHPDRRPGDGRAAIRRRARRRLAGLRTELLQHGVLIEAANTIDVFASARGGVDGRDTVSNLFELAITADTDALAGLRGGTLFFLGLGTHGDDPGSASGTVHAPSNLAADDAWRVLEFWYEQSLLADRAGLLFGFYAVDSEFDAKETAGVFLNGGFGTGLELSETGLNGPSVYPVTGLALRGRFQVTP